MKIHHRMYQPRCNQIVGLFACHLLLGQETKWKKRIWNDIKIIEKKMNQRHIFSWVIRKEKINTNRKSKCTESSCSSPKSIQIDWIVINKNRLKCQFRCLCNNFKFKRLLINFSKSLIFTYRCDCWLSGQPLYQNWSCMTNNKASTLFPVFRRQFRCVFMLNSIRRRVDCDCILFFGRVKEVKEVVATECLYVIFDVTSSRTVWNIFIKLWVMIRLAVANKQVNAKANESMTDENKKKKEKCWKKKHCFISA